MNSPIHALRNAQDDLLVINDATRHQYYSTMQAEVCDEDLLDAAYNRRHARAIMARREHRRLTVWLISMSVCAALGLAWSLA